MREIFAEQITKTVAKLCIQACTELPEDVKQRIYDCRACETWHTAQDVLDVIIENFETNENIPLCQDTGMACVFISIGQDVHVVGNLYDAIHEGVAKGYAEGFLRKSVVADPIRRVNTGDNTPAMIYTEIVPGDRLEITVAPKGFGSENMSCIAMLKPADGIEGIKSFVMQTVENAGPNACPPLSIGVGIGGTFDKAAFLAKKALLRDMGQHNSDPYYAELEQELLAKINHLGIGPQGLGGKTTALSVAVEVLPTHIAGLPCAVNINCHSARHATEVI
ncbi:MAG: fumarate hydratase [Oscillospiraceae bacterium]|nr:fumarate hydratase [Oscillospiraceae bacterium]